MNYTENSTDAFAESAQSRLVKEIHSKVNEMKYDTRLGVSYMTMIMRDRILSYEAEARGEYRKTVSIAKEMLNENFSADVISRITKLSYEDISKLQEELTAS